MYPVEPIGGGTAPSQIYGASSRQRCGNDGQRKRVAHMPTATTTKEDSRSKLVQNHPHDFTKKPTFIFLLRHNWRRSCERWMRFLTRRGPRRRALVAQDHVQQRAVNFQVAAVVVDEAEPSKLVHEKADARARGADHLRKRLLADLCDDRLGLGVL